MYSPAGPIPAPSQPIAAALKGKAPPLIPRVDITVMDEGQARWLAFLNSESDVLFSLPVQFHRARRSSPAKLKPELAAKGVVHQAFIAPSVRVTPVSTWRTSLSAATPPRRLRCVGLSAWPTTSPKRSACSIRGVRFLRKVPSRRTLRGYDAKLRTNAQLYDPGAARALL